MARLAGASRAPPDALEDPGADEHAGVGGEPAAHGGDGEPDDPDGEHRACAPGGRPATRRGARRRPGSASSPRPPTATCPRRCERRARWWAARCRPRWHRWRRCPNRARWPRSPSVPWLVPNASWPSPSPSAFLRHRSRTPSRAHLRGESGTTGGVDAGPGRLMHRRVSTSAPVAVTARVCSNCAVRRPSAVTAVQPSSQATCRQVPSGDHRLDGEGHAGLHDRVGGRARSSGGSAGAEWNTSPMPWPQ